MPEPTGKPIKFVVLAPGHFHAALLLKQPIAEVHPRVHVYAPLDQETIEYLQRVRQFNDQPEYLRTWELDLRCGANYRERCFREQPGNTLVLSGRNKPKIDAMIQAVENNWNVLADKPWIIDGCDFPKLLQLEREAERREVFIHDMMTERFEITNILLRQFIQEPTIFGQWQPSTPDAPSLSLMSVHHIYKLINGEPVRRPVWWFDPATTGEGLADVGTHLIDLALGFVSPDKAVDWQDDVEVIDSNRWCLPVALRDFRAATGAAAFPESFAVSGRDYEFNCNGRTTIRIKDVFAGVTVSWEWASEYGEFHEIQARGTRATVRSAPIEEFGPQQQVVIHPRNSSDTAELLANVQRWCENADSCLPGLSAVELDERIVIHIPDSLRTNHENLFSAVVHQYVRGFLSKQHAPSWEKPNRIAKYYLTTKAVEMARKNRSDVADRLTECSE